MFAFQRLDARYFIVTYHFFALSDQGWRLLIMVIDVRDLLLGLLIIPRRQPIPDLMGFDIPLFLKDGWRGGPKSVRLSLVS